MCAVKVLCLSCTSEPLCSSLYVLVAARLRCYSPTDGNHVTTTQAVGTLLGTMFGFVSAALLTPIHGGEREDGLPAAPGVVSYSLRLVFTDVSRPTSRSTTSSRNCTYSHCCLAQALAVTCSLVVLFFGVFSASHNSGIARFGSFLPPLCANCLPCGPKRYRIIPAALPNTLEEKVSFSTGPTKLSGLRHDCSSSSSVSAPLTSFARNGPRRRLTVIFLSGYCCC